MTDEEEKELFERQEKNRITVIESILAVPQGRRMFTDPLLRFSSGGDPGVSLLDGSWWGIAEGRLPESRRDELEGIIATLKGRYLRRDSVRDLHLNWHAVETMGEALFAGVGECRELVRLRNSIMEPMRQSPVPVEVLAAVCDSMDGHAGEENWIAWSVHPRLASVASELDLIEARTGAGICAYLEAENHFRRATESMKEVVERFVEANLGLVVTIVRRCSPSGVMEEMDLIQEGCQGLMEAVRRFDSHRGIKLSTYAVWWIRKCIMKSVMKDSRLVRLPVNVQKQVRDIRDACDMFGNERGRPPSLCELAEFMERDRREIEEVCLSTGPLLSLDRSGGEHDATLADFLEGKLQPPDEAFMDSDLRRRIDTALASLSDRDKTIITLRFGLLDDEPCTLQQVGGIFGITRERVRQLENRALARLREHGLITSLITEGDRQ